MFLPCARHRGDAVKKVGGDGHKFILSQSSPSSGEIHNKRENLVKSCIRSDECHGEKAGRGNRKCGGVHMEVAAGMYFRPGGQERPH